MFDEFIATSRIYNFDLKQLFLRSFCLIVNFNLIYDIMIYDINEIIRP